MIFETLNRTEGMGLVVINGQLTVAVFETSSQTVIRTSAGGDNTSFVVAEGVQDVVDRFTARGIRFVHLTRKRDGNPVFINVKHIVGIYERGGFTTIRTNAAGEHAEHAVTETIPEATDKITEDSASARDTGVDAPANAPKAKRSSAKKSAD